MYYALLVACLLGGTPESVYRAAEAAADRDAIIASWAKARDASAKQVAAIKKAKIGPAAKGHGHTHGAKALTFSTADSKKKALVAAESSLASAEAEVSRLKKGGLIRLNFDEDHPRVGAAGFIQNGIKIIQVLDTKSVLVIGLNCRENEFWILSGIDTSEMADGQLALPNIPLAATGTTAYQAVTGAKRTVVKVEVVDLGAGGK